MSIKNIALIPLIAYFQGNVLGETLSRQAPEFKLPPHHSAHRDLTPYADLMLWLKNSDFDCFTQLSKVKKKFIEYCLLLKILCRCHAILYDEKKKFSGKRDGC